MGKRKGYGFARVSVERKVSPPDKRRRGGEPATLVEETDTQPGRPCGA
jgi:hypothetical protein